MSDPIPGNPISQGSWNKITGTLTWLGGDRVLETPGKGHYRLWRYDSTANGTDPFPDPGPILEGDWKTIDGFRDLLYLGGDRVLTWVPGGLTVPFRIWHFDRTATSGDPLPGDPIIQGSWNSAKIRYDGLYYLGRDRLLYLDSATNQYQIFRYDRTMSGGGDPLIWVLGGQWASIDSNNNLSYLDGDRLLDWKENGLFSGKTGSHYRVWRYDRYATGDPLPGSPVNEGDWSSIDAGPRVSMVYLGGDRVLEYSWALAPQPATYRLWAYARDTPYVGGLGDTHQLSVGADGSVWGVDDMYRLWRWNDGLWVQPTDYARAVQVTVGNASTIWHLNSIRQIWQWTGGGWNQAEDINVINIDVAGDGTLWAIHPAGNVFRWNGVAWEEPTTYARGVQVAVGNQTTVVHRNSIGEMWAWTGSGWNQMPGKAIHISAGADGTICHVGVDNRVYRWTGSAWQELPSNNQAALVGVGEANTIWYMDLSNVPHRWNGTGFDQLPSLPV